MSYIQLTENAPYNSQMESITTNTDVHADIMNPIFKQLLENDEYVKNQIEQQGNSEMIIEKSTIYTDALRQITSVKNLTANDIVFVDLDSSFDDLELAKKQKEEWGYITNIGLTNNGDLNVYLSKAPTNNLPIKLLILKQPPEKNGAVFFSKGVQNSKLDYCGISDEITVQGINVKVFSALISNGTTTNNTKITGLCYDYAVPDTIKTPEFMQVNVFFYNASNQQLFSATYLSKRSSSAFSQDFYGYVDSYGLQNIAPDRTGVAPRTIRLFLCKTYAFEPFTSYDHVKINIKIGGIPNE